MVMAMSASISLMMAMAQSYRCYYLLILFFFSCSDFSDLMCHLTFFFSLSPFAFRPMDDNAVCHRFTVHTYSPSQVSDEHEPQMMRSLTPLRLFLLVMT